MYQIISSQAKPESTKKFLPILSWNQVSEFIGSTKISSHEIKEQLSYFYADNNRWYALRIQGDAMQSPLGNSRSFHAGDNTYYTN